MWNEALYSLLNVIQLFIKYDTNYNIAIEIIKTTVIGYIGKL